MEGDFPSSFRNMKKRAICYSSFHTLGKSDVISFLQCHCMGTSHSSFNVLAKDSLSFFHALERVIHYFTFHSQQKAFFHLSFCVQEKGFTLPLLPCKRQTVILDSTLPKERSVTLLLCEGKVRFFPASCPWAGPIAPNGTSFTPLSSPSMVQTGHI
jgi:hypothetical protein